jgi:CHRD domain
MRRTRVRLAIGVALLGTVMAVSAVAVAGSGKTKAKLSGFEEVPAVITNGTGKLKLRIDDSAQTIAYELSYSGLEGGTVLAAHIHVGQRTANGDVAAFLCGGGGQPGCPQPAGTVSDSIVPAEVQQTDQGVEAGEFADLVRAIRSGVAYANVHTTKYPGGEVRGQIGDKNGHRKHNGDRSGHNGDNDD